MDPFWTGLLLLVLLLANWERKFLVKSAAFVADPAVSAANF